MTLFEHASAWTFRGLRLFDRWMSEPAARGDARLCVVRTSGPMAQRVVDDVAQGRALFDCYRDGRRRLIRLDNLDGPGDILGELEKQASGVRSAEGFTGQTLVVHTTIHDARGRDHWNEISDAIEDFCKHYDVAVRAYATDTPAFRVAGTTIYDFLVGWPSDGVLDSAEAGKQRLWCAYLHARLAWETGGDLDRALAWLDTKPRIRTGDDEAAEAWFQNSSITSFRRLSQDAKRRAIQNLNRASIIDERAVADGTYWRPPGCHEVRPVPWAARALLADNQSTNFTELLRAAIACLPLAGEILRRCIDGEARLRGDAVMRRLTSSRTPSEQAVIAHAQFVKRRLRSVVYPTAHPAPPNAERDVWTFAPLGEIVNTSCLSGEPRLRAELLRDLRNAMAHGHYVCWRHVEQTLEL